MKQIKVQQQPNNYFKVRLWWQLGDQFSNQLRDKINGLTWYQFGNNSCYYYCSRLFDFWMHNYRTDSIDENKK